MPSYQYRKSHCGDKTILRPSYLHNGISYTSKMTSLYWIRAQILIAQHSVIITSWHEYALRITGPLWEGPPMNSPCKGQVMRSFAICLSLLIWHVMTSTWHHSNGVFASDRWKDRRHDVREIPVGCRGIFAERRTGNAKTPWCRQMEVDFATNSPGLHTRSFGKAGEWDLIRLWSAIG